MLHADEIRGFRGDWRFLGTMHVSPFEWEGAVYRSAEHAYQSAKHPEAAAEILRRADPKEAKAFARSLPEEGRLVPPAAWDAVKDARMLEVQRAKFRREPLRTGLLATGDARLVHENAHGDAYWGVVPGEGGRNRLGAILMRVRAELREGLGEGELLLLH